MKLSKKVVFCILVVFAISIQAVFADAAIDAIKAVSQNDINVLQKLLDGGLDPNLIGVENYQASLLNTACRNNSIEMVKLLLANGADVNLKGYGEYTALMWASESAKTTEIMELLIEKGADIHPIAQDGVNALIKAIFGVLSDSGSLAAVKLLIDKGMDVNYAIDAEDATGYTALMFAVRWGKIEVVKFLISAGADVNAKGKEDSTPLGIANEEGYSDIAKLLRDSGAKE